MTRKILSQFMQNYSDNELNKSDESFKTFLIETTLF